MRVRNETNQCYRNGRTNYISATVFFIYIFKQVYYLTVRQSGKSIKGCASSKDENYKQE